MKEKTDFSPISGIALWAFLLCLAWFGHFNNWWPAAFPITFTIIIGVLYGIAFIAATVLFIIKRLS
jgi:hypothetical protein